MRIAIVASPHVPVPPVKYGGTELVISNLIKGLQERGHEVILIGPGDSTVDCEVIPTVKKSLHFPQKRADVAAFNTRIAAIEQRTKAALRKLLPRIDIIHSHGFDLKPFRNFPNLTTLHSHIAFDELTYYKRRKDLYYVSISNNQQGAYPDLKYVGTIYNGEDPEAFPIVKRPKNYVCFLGRFDRDKNPHLAIQLAVNLGIKIKVAGKIDYLSDGYYEEEVARYLSHPLVEFMGELNFEQKTELLANAKCNLHPTGFREPFGLSVLEAAYCGTPTLAIERGSMPELIEEGRTGMLVEDFVEGYHQIEECFKMDREYIANRARLLFNYKTMSKQYDVAYRQVIKIFSAKSAQDQVLKSLANKARKGLTDIWNPVSK